MVDEPRKYSSDANFTIMRLDPTTDEDDMRRTLANKLRGRYLIGGAAFGRREVAVVEQRDIDTVLACFDVIDRHTGRWYQGKSVWDI